jgi:hypothetical protein
MILDAVLLALAELSSTQTRGVAILPEMRITQGDGVQISHPISRYELWLSGNVDYAVIEYDDVRDYKGESDNYPLHPVNCFTASSDRLLAPSRSREDAFDISKARLFLVEAKCQSLDQSLVFYIPEAVSQAIALLKSAKCATTACFASLFDHCLPAFQRSVSVYLMGRHGFSLS